MADIDVERKGTSIWPWILGLLVLALLAWAVIEMLDDDDAEIVETDPIVAPVAETPAAVPMAAAVPPAVTTYLSQCTELEGASTAEMGLGHTFTVNCFEQLREGISAVVSGQSVPDANVTEQMTEYESTVQQLEQSDSMASTHSEMTRNAATTAATVLQALQSAWYAMDQQASTAVTEVESAATSIDASAPLLEQRDAVHGFFREAGEALRMMANQPAGAV